MLVIYIYSRICARFYESGPPSAPHIVGTAGQIEIYIDQSSSLATVQIMSWEHVVSRLESREDVSFIIFPMSVRSLWWKHVISTLAFLWIFIWLCGYMLSTCCFFCNDSSLCFSCWAESSTSTRFTISQGGFPSTHLEQCEKKRWFYRMVTKNDRIFLPKLWRLFPSKIEHIFETMYTQWKCHRSCCNALVKPWSSCYHMFVKSIMIINMLEYHNSTWRRRACCLRWNTRNFTKQTASQFGVCLRTPWKDAYITFAPLKTTNVQCLNFNHHQCQFAQTLQKAAF